MIMMISDQRKQKVSRHWIRRTLDMKTRHATWISWKVSMTTYYELNCWLTHSCNSTHNDNNTFTYTLHDANRLDWFQLESKFQNWKWIPIPCLKDSIILYNRKNKRILNYNTVSYRPGRIMILIRLDLLSYRCYYFIIVMTRNNYIMLIFYLWFRYLAHYYVMFNVDEIKYKSPQNP